MFLVDSLTVWLIYSFNHSVECVKSNWWLHMWSIRQHADSIPRQCKDQEAPMVDSKSIFTIRFSTCNKISLRNCYCTLPTFVQRHHRDESNLHCQAWPKNVTAIAAPLWTLTKLYKSATADLLFWRLKCKLFQDVRPIRHKYQKQAVQLCYSTSLQWSFIWYKNSSIMSNIHYRRRSTRMQ